MQFDERTVAKKYGIQDPELVQTIARKYRDAAERVLECHRCSRKFRVKNAKADAVYTCLSCSGVLVDVPPEIVKTVRADELGLIVDDGIPAEVKEVMRDPTRCYGRYILMRKLGEGGMGEVYKAYDVLLGRYVALKFIKSEQAEELKAEAKTLASLNHKNIAQIYDIGSARGRGFISMQYIDGKPIKKYQDMVAVCQAVDYAHKLGVVHRDIKPDNILVDSQGNVYVMDFGLAIKGSSDDIAGTPAYLPPELKGSQAGDIYSLGATLYFLVSGKLPIVINAGDTLETVLARVKSGVRVPLPAGVPRELRAIIEKAMNKDPAKRYATAQEMGEDLRRYISGEPVHAYSRSDMYRLRKYIQRRKVAFALGAVALLIVSVVGVIAYFKYEESKIERENRQKKEIELQTTRERYWRSVQRSLENLRAAVRETLNDILQARRRKEPPTMYEIYASAKNILVLAYEDVLEAEKEAAGHVKPSAEPHYLMGRLLRLVSEYDSAMEYQNKSLAVDPSYAPSLYEVAVLLSTKYRQEYQRTYEELVRLRSQGAAEAKGAMKFELPTQKEVEEHNASLKEIENEIIRRIEEFEKSPTQSLLSAGAVDSARGIMLSYKREKVKAREYLERAIEKDGELEEAYEALSNALENYEDREAYLSRAVEKLPGSSGLWKLRGDALYGIGRQLDSIGKDPLEAYGKAEEYYAQAIDLNRNNAEAWMSRGTVHKNRGLYLASVGKDPLEAYAKAEEYHARAIDLDRNNAEAWMRRGLVHNNRGGYLHSVGKDPLEAYGKAEEYIGRAIDLNRNNAEAWMRRGMVHTNRGRYLYSVGKDPLEAYAKAEEYYARAIDLNRNNAEAWMWRGLVHNNRGLYLASVGKDPLEAYGKAEEYIGRAIDLNRNNAEAWMWRGLVHNNRGVYLASVGKDPLEAFGKAEEYYARSIDLNPNNAEAWKRRGLVQNNRGGYLHSVGKDPLEAFGKAEEYYARAIDLNPNDAEAWMRRGAVHTTRGAYLASVGKDPLEAYGKAEEYYARAIDLNPNNAEAWMTRGGVHTTRGAYLASVGKDPLEAYGKAEEYIGRAIDLNRNNAEARMWRGLVHNNRGVYLASVGKDPLEAYAKAEEYYGQAIDLNPNNAEAWMRRGRVAFNSALWYESARGGKDYSRAGDSYASAVQYFTKALTLNPNLERQCRQWLDTATRKVREMRQKAGEY